MFGFNSDQCFFTVLITLPSLPLYLLKHEVKGNILRMQYSKWIFQQAEGKKSKIILAITWKLGNTSWSNLKKIQCLETRINKH